MTENTPQPPPATPPRPAAKELPGAGVLPGAGAGAPRGWLGGAVGCLFRDRDWPARYWVVPVCALIPVVNLVLLRGWRLELTRNLARQQPTALPDPSRFVFFPLVGLLLWFVTFVYHLPHLAFGVLHAVHLAHAASKGGEGLVRELVLVVAVTLAVTVLTWPLYRVAVLRYAVTGSLASFVMLPQNLVLVLRHAHRFAGLWLTMTLLVIVNALVLAVLSATLIGLVLAVLLTVPLYYAVSGHLYAQLASRLARRHGWFVPLPPGADPRGPRTPKRAGVAGLVAGLAASVVGLLLLLAAAAGLAVWTGALDPAGTLESWRGFDPAAAWRNLVGGFTLPPEAAPLLDQAPDWLAPYLEPLRPEPPDIPEAPEALDAPPTD